MAANNVLRTANTYTTKPGTPDSVRKLIKHSSSAKLKAATVSFPWPKKIDFHPTLITKDSPKPWLVLVVHSMIDFGCPFRNAFFSEYKC